MNRLKLLIVFPICLLAALFGAVRMLYCIASNPQKAWVLAVSFDQLANAAANGDPDETLSSRANRARKERRIWGCRMCAVLDWLDPDHCKRSSSDIE